MDPLGNMDAQKHNQTPQGNWTKQGEKRLEVSMNFIITKYKMKTTLRDGIYLYLPIAPSASMAPNTGVK